MIYTKFALYLSAAELLVFSSQAYVAAACTVLRRQNLYNANNLVVNTIKHACVIDFKESSSSKQLPTFHFT